MRKIAILTFGGRTLSETMPKWQNLRNGAALFKLAHYLRGSGVESLDASCHICLQPAQAGRIGQNNSRHRNQTLTTQDRAFTSPHGWNGLWHTTEAPQ